MDVRKMSLQEQNIHKRLAKILMLRNRAGIYLSLLSFVMMLKVFWETFDNKMLAYILLIGGFIGLCLITWYDYKNIMKHEQGMNLQNNNEWQDLKERLDRIEKRLMKK
jgi:hypothetical protein